MKEILVLGDFPYCDWQHVEGKADTKIITSNLNDFILKIENEKYDLVVFPLEGAVIRGIFEENQHQSSFGDFWKDKTVKKVAWSMDSHHQWQTEVQYQYFFDTYYLAHSEYMDKFDTNKTKWLPCSLLVDKDRYELLRFSDDVGEKIVDIVSVYRNYLHIGDRNAVMNDYYQYLLSHNYSVFAGQTQQMWQGKLNMNRYYQALSAGNIILNVSIKDDLNMRNFEALALNQIMVTNRVPDHDKIDLDYGNTVFFDRYDMSSFDRAIKEAMEKTKQPRKRTIDSVINQHMLIHRYVEIFNNELGLNLVVPNIDVDSELAKLKEKRVPMVGFCFDSEKGDIQYDNIEMMTKGLYSYLQHNRFEDAMRTGIALADYQGENLAKHMDDLLHSFNQCIDRLKEGFKVEMCLLSVIKAITVAIKRGATLQAVISISKLISKMENLQSARSTLIVVYELKYELKNILLEGIKMMIAKKNYPQSLQFVAYIEQLAVDLAADDYSLFAETNRLAGQKEKALEYYKKSLQ